MDQVRIGVIGCGGMARAHMNVFKEIPQYKFTAASDVFDANLKTVVDEFGVKGFNDGHDLIKSGECDAVLIATPHYFHPTYAIAAMEAGLHALTEKPVAVTAKSAAEANACAKAHPELKFAVMFQLRTGAQNKAIKQIIDSGQLGELRRVLWTATNWFRTQAYYDSGSWRATWEGEGGGVLLNQCPHDLDLLWWFAGCPSRITANISLGKYHDIEVEDDVTAMIEYPNGATGVFIASTGESPGTSFIEFVGDRGKLTVKRGEALVLHQTNGSVDEFCRGTPKTWANLDVTKMTIEPPNDNGSHKVIHENFVRAIIDNEPLIAPAVEGLHSVEMANAMIMSGIEGRPIDVPTDHDAYERMLKGLIAESKAKV